MAGVLKPQSGEVAIHDASLIGRTPDAIRRRGVAVVPKGHQVLGDLTTLDNLRAAGSMLSRQDVEAEIDRVLGLFPELRERLSVEGRSLPGGQKQMLAISQALIARPQFLLVDELSFGLAPAVVQRLTSGTSNGLQSHPEILHSAYFTRAAHSARVNGRCGRTATTA